MKPSALLSVVLCAGIVCAIIYLNRSKTAPPPAPVSESSPGPAADQTTEETNIVSKPEPPQTIPQAASEPARSPAPAPVANETKSAEPTNEISRIVDALLSPKIGDQKRVMFDQLRSNGQLDQVIAELKQRAAENTNDPGIPTTLGEALYNKVRAINEAGGTDQNEMGILAMQADQSFNAALKIDPKNWEAQFVKASSMYYWPANPERDNDAVQRLMSLIDQQENMTSHPAFARTYAVLGDQYVKIGQPDKAEATWRLGLERFPNDPTLRAKVSGR